LKKIRQLKKLVQTNNISVEEALNRAYLFGKERGRKDE